MLFNLTGERVKGIYVNHIMINKHVGTLHHVAAVSCGLQLKSQGKYPG